jgi:hypothetical protein
MKDAFVAEQRWETYEEVAQYLIEQFAEGFELGDVEGKQVVAGNSGTNWELDGKGIREDGQSIVLIECKRYTTRKVTQETIAGMAFRISDTNADGGIIVSPLGLQNGAEKVAAHTDITTVKLDQNSTTQEYVMQFLNNFCMGFVENIRLNMSDSLSITMIDSDGNIIEQRNE